MKNRSCRVGCVIFARGSDARVLERIELSKWGLMDKVESEFI